MKAKWYYKKHEPYSELTMQMIRKVQKRHLIERIKIALCLIVKKPYPTF